MKDGEIVLCEAVEIMESLPKGIQQDEQIMECVMTSLQEGVSKLQVRQDALEIAQMRLQQTVAHGFALVNGQFVEVKSELQTMKHDAEKDRIHAQYARDDANKARVVAEQALSKTHEIATMAAVANANAIGATNVAKVASNKSGGFDPMMGFVMTGMVLVIAFIMLSVRVERTPSAPATSLKKELQDFCSERAGNCATAQPVYGNRNGI
jgi:hypothetical protein